MNIQFTDLVYRGSESGENFKIRFERRVNESNENDAENLFSEISLDTKAVGGNLDIKLTAPRQGNTGILDHWFNRDGKWHAVIEISGPSQINIDAHTDFSTFQTISTAGSLSLSTDFTTSTVTRHTGELQVNADFSSLNGDEINGAFDINSSFSHIVLMLSRLSNDSRVTSSFGGTEIGLPRNTGAVFSVQKGFSGIRFNTSGRMTSGTGNQRILNGGGPSIALHSDFGDIRVKDNLKQYEAVAYDLAEGKTVPQSPAEKTPSAQEFEKGVIRSVHIYGAHLRSSSYILNKLTIKEGEVHTREEVAQAVKALEDDKIVEYTSFVIDAQGNLRIHIYEIEPFTKKFDLFTSYTRVGGFGLGPVMKINSTVAPLSEVYGKAQYHWGNKDWTWEAGGFKQFFTANKLRIGGGYRYDFASNMDWAVPPLEAYLNAFLLGHELVNYYHVEGGRGYISQSMGDHFRGRFEYFEDNYSSVDKAANWSLFKQGRIKEENPPLGAGSVGGISGSRFILDFHNEDTVSNYRIVTEMENTYKSRAGDLPGYTRFFGSAAWQMLYWYGSLVKFRLAGGYSKSSLPDQRAFRLGGVNTLRGFDPGSVPAPPSGNTGFTYQGGGDRMVMANIDYFYGQGISLIFFGDIGGVWKHNEAATAGGLRRDLGIGIALGSDFFTSVGDGDIKAGFRVNCAVPVGPEEHKARWTVNFIRAY